MANLEIIIGAAAAFMLGFGWYTFAFGKAWQGETGITEEQAQEGMTMTHGLTFLMMCILSFGVNYVINLHTLAEQTFVHGAFHGALAGALYAVPAIAINYLYQKKSLKLFLIDASYLIALMALSGGVMAALKLGVVVAEG